TLFVGAIATEDRRLFVKAYRKPDETILAVHQASFIHYYFHQHFTTVKPTQYDENFVFYPLLPHKAKEPDMAKIAETLIVISQEYHDVFRFNTKPALDYVNLNLPSLLQKEGRIEFWKELRNLLTASPAIASIPVHGDITPWNLFNSDHTLPVLIDYERAGWHVPYYDWWHLQYQYAILHHKTPSLDNLLNKLQRASGQDRVFLLRTGLIYMLDQLSYDLQDREDYPKYKNRLTNAIQTRFKIAESFVRKLHEAANAA
ncbi:MAG TPA: phosphotransferase, partial [Alphaproteobacteria bacterium]